MDRRDIGSWIAGPSSALEAQGIDLGYRGERLGLPEAGVGSTAGFGRRGAAILIDWISVAIITQLFMPGSPYGSSAHALVTLVVFFLVKSAFTWLGGSTPGQKLLGIRVASVTDKPYLGVFRSLIRTFLVCLVIPAVVWDRDTRTLADRGVGSIVVKTR